MKILFIGNTPGLNNIEKFYLTEQRLINGFTRLGHSTFCFNDRDQSKYLNLFRRQKLGCRAMNEKLIKSTLIYKPDLIVLSNCKNVSNDTLERIRDDLPSVRIIYQNVDPLSEKGNVKAIQQRVGVVDVVFITTAGDALKQFASSSTKICYFPNPVDKAIDQSCAYKNKNANIEVLLLGRELRHQTDPRNEIAKFIISNNFSGVRHCIGGVGINQDLYYGAEYLEILNNTKIGISQSKVNDHYLYASDRFSHYLASGICTFIPKGAQFEDILGDKAFVEYESPSDLWDKVIYYLGNDKERVKVAENGYNISHDRFSVDKVCQYMIETAFGEPLSLAYAWPTEPAGHQI